MKITEAGLSIIKQCEGVRLKAYKCPAGIWTIGYGHTKGVFDVMRCTQAQAEQWLKEDVVKAEKAVDKYSKYNWNQNEFDALVSFAFNIGGISALTAYGTRTKFTIANKILEYNKATVGGKKVTLNGLVKRRTMEYNLFNTPATTKQATTTVKQYSLKKNGNTYISKNFKVKEFRCKDGSDTILIDVEFVTDVLQTIRDHFNSPVTINSAYRTEAYNKKVGGALASQHKLGRAFDIVVKGVSPLTVCQYAEALGVKGIGFYKTFSHVDSRTGTKKRWNSTSGKEIAVTKF